MVGQPYDLDASKEYVIRGNSALIKCQYPSFMSDFLQVESWTIDDNVVVTYSDVYGIHHSLTLPNLTQPNPILTPILIYPHPCQHTLKDPGRS